MFEDDSEIRGRTDGRKMKNGTKKGYKDKMRFKNKNGNTEEVVDEGPKKKWSGKDYRKEESSEEEVEEKKEETEVKPIKEYGKNLGVYVREEDEE
jgi:hypothetical protein